MTLLTALELAGNYPDNVLITSKEYEGGKFAAFCYRLKDGDVHKLMLSTDAVFKSAEKAERYMHEVAKDIKQRYAEKEERRV